MGGSAEAGHGRLPEGKDLGFISFGGLARSFIPRDLVWGSLGDKGTEKTKLPGKTINQCLQNPHTAGLF